MNSSSLSVLKTLFPDDEERSMKRPVTVATQFKVTPIHVTKRKIFIFFYNFLYFFHFFWNFLLNFQLT